ncbi:hypothetical protein FOD75_11050 (plasmid) [Limosilactobacillus reuteri]|uniref:Uncharacterized protein n=1 Tax=Limosilactobacillus reuteri TaxID=1598 RepID=A0A517D8F9_LIMRT|nr:hypothetical protein [Limosilactobacillus reuteri]QDR73626.1 hypothetical protein FOD75_11050 [Limosilactobacillus reuteri]
MAEKECYLEVRIVAIEGEVFQTQSFFPTLEELRDAVMDDFRTSKELHQDPEWVFDNAKTLQFKDAWISKGKFVTRQVIGLTISYESLRSEVKQELILDNDEESVHDKD